jgi:hypothetical protein
MEEDLISLDTLPPERAEDSISLDPKQYRPVTPEIAEVRAQKVDFSKAVPELTKEQVYNKIIQGEEQKIRERVAGDQMARQQIRRQQLIELLAKRKGGPITPEEIKRYIDEPEVSASPDTALEKEYADQYMKFFGQPYTNSKGWNWGDTVYGEALTEIPGLTEKSRKLGSNLVAQREWLLNLYQNVQGTRSQQSWGAFGVDIAKIFVPTYAEIKQRGYADETSFWYGLLGTHIEELAREVFNLPVDKFKDKIYPIVDKLREDNPTLALMFLGALMGQSKSEQFLNNIFTVADISQLPGLAKTVFKGTKTMADVWKVHKTVRDGLKEVADAVKSGAVDPKIAAPKASGDMGEAAVQTVAKEINVSGKGVPIAATPANVEEDLFSYMKGAVSEIEANPGNSSRELILRLRQAYNETVAKVGWAVNKAVRVERVPEMLAQDVRTARALKDAILDTYTGPKNGILNIEAPFREPATNTYYGKVNLGQPSGELWASETTAKLYAESIGYPTASVEKTAIKGPGKLVLTEEWQPIPKDAILPPGLEIRMDMATGRNFARIPSGSKEKFAPISVEREGFGWKIVIKQPVPETSDPIRALHNTTPGTREPDSLIKGWLDWIRTPEDTLTKEHNAMRKAAQYGATVLMQVMKEEAKHISDLSKGLIRYDPVTGERIGFIRNRLQKWWSQATRENARRWNQWEETVNFAQEATDPITKQKGYFFRNPAEFEDHYRTHYRRIPEPAEVESYFAVTRRLEMDAVARVLAEYRNIHREGGRYFRLFTSEIASATPGPNLPARLRKYSDWVVGTPIKDMPGSEAAIWIEGPSGGRLYTRGKIDTQFRKDISRALKEGTMKGFRVHYPDRTPLTGWGKVKDDDWVQFVITPYLEEKSLDFNLLPRRGGGHFDYDYDWYQKQGNVNFDKTTLSYVYKGDATAQPVSNRAKGLVINERWNDARKLIHEGKLTEAEAFVKANLPHSWEEFHGWFKPSKFEGKSVPARFRTDLPFEIVPKDKLIVDLDNRLAKHYTDQGRKFRDGTKEWNPARQFQVQYTGKRDAWEVFATKDVGTRHNPVFQATPAEKIPVLQSLDRSLQRIIHSLFFDDYKMHAVEHWLKQATPHLKATENEIKAQPYYHFSVGADAKMFRTGTPVEVLENLRANHWKINQLLGVPSKFENVLMSGAQRMADIMYNSFGSAEGRAKFSPVRAFIVTPPAMINKISEPWQFLRSLAFYPTMGFWAIPQIFVQSQTFAAIYSIAGMKYANAGTFATLLHQYYRLSNRSPAILDKIDEISSKFKTSILTGVRWKPGEVKESIQVLERSGWSNVGGEYVSIDTPWAGQGVVEHLSQRFLDASLFFFRGAERNVKFAAWHVAFKEFRDKFPTKTITNLDVTAIINRADLLNTNMSRASSSILHTGFMSLASQFLAYQLRTAELFWGKRLADTVKERAIIRARIVAWYSALYGLPVAGTATGLPVADLFRKRALEGTMGADPYIVGENDVQTLVMEGLPAYLTALATGGGDIKKGNFYNFPARYGPSGYTPILDFLKSDKEWYELAMGASFSVMKGLYDGFSPTVQSFLAAARGEPTEFAPVIEDLVDVAKVITTANSAYRSMVAINTGNWISKKGIVLTNVGGIESVLLGATGLQPTAVTDLHLKTWTLKNEQELHKHVLDQFVKELRRGLDVAEKSPEQAHKFYRRAFTYLIAGGYPEERIPAAIALAARDYENLIERIDERFYVRNAPIGMQDKRLKAYQTQQDIRMNK